MPQNHIVSEGNIMQMTYVYVQVDVLQLFLGWPHIYPNDLFVCHKLKNYRKYRGFPGKNNLKLEFSANRLHFA
jgi:hypothetical protein